MARHNLAGRDLRHVREANIPGVTIETKLGNTFVEVPDTAEAQRLFNAALSRSYAEFESQRAGR